jgi:hypothetical protein
VPVGVELSVEYIVDKLRFLAWTMGTNFLKILDLIWLMEKLENEPNAAFCS